jgi:hypothetical protein
MKKLIRRRKKAHEKNVEKRTCSRLGCPKSRLAAFVIKQLREVPPPTLFFVIGFNLIVLTTQLVLADYLIHFANFMLVAISALVVGKAVLVANALPFLRRFDTAPIVQPVLFKTFVY